MELNLAPWIKKRFKLRKKMVLTDFKRTSVDQKRDELDAKMVSRHFKVNLYFEIDLIELKIRNQIDKGEFYFLKIIGFSSLSLKCSIFWVQF